MSEVWKDIPGYEGLYQVSNLGNVKSLDRTIERKDGRSNFYKGVLMKPRLDNEGRPYIFLSKNKKRKRHKIQSLVSFVFIGPKPDAMVVCHKDSNVQNNQLINLRYDTQSQNMIDMYRQGGKSSSGVLTIEQVLEIRNLYSEKDYKQYELAEMFKVSQRTIGNIVNRISFQWLNDDGTIQESNTAVS